MRKRRYTTPPKKPVLGMVLPNKLAIILTYGNLPFIRLLGGGYLNIDGAALRKHIGRSVSQIAIGAAMKELLTWGVLTDLDETYGGYLIKLAEVRGQAYVGIRGEFVMHVEGSLQSPLLSREPYSPPKEGAQRKERASVERLLRTKEVMENGRQNKA